MGSSDSCAEASTSAKHQDEGKNGTDSILAPNRHDFEKEIWRLNNNISKLSSQIKQYWTENRRTQLQSWRQESLNLRGQYNTESTQERTLAESLKQLQEHLQTKQREIHEMEDADLTYKNLPLAQQKLATAEQRYKRGTYASMREEQAQVTEINRLKRNVAKLGRYLPLVDEKKALDEKIKTSRQDLRKIHSTMRDFRDRQQSVRSKIREIQQAYMKLRNHLLQLKEEKRALVEQYDSDRCTYTAWLKRNGLAKNASTFPTAMLDNSQDQFEPFYEQKRNCERLIRYLRGLVPTAEAAPENDHATDETSDSADEFPDSFRHLSIKPNTKTKKKQGGLAKKAAKNPTLSITHDIDYIRQFNDLEVDPPKTYAEVERALGEVQKVLEFYEDQTTIPTDDGYLSPIPSVLSMSGSEVFDSPLMSPNSASSSSLLLMMNDSTQDFSVTDQQQDGKPSVARYATVD